MVQSLEFPIVENAIAPFGGWDALSGKLKEYGIDGLDGVWLPNQRDTSAPNEMLIGHHIFTMFDWLDYWLEDDEELLRRLGTKERIKQIYGADSSHFLMSYLFSLHDAIQCGVQYVSMDVCNVTFEECQTYRWRHDDYAVMDAALEIINMILKGVEPTFDFLIENSWWPGFQFTDPKKTEYLLSGINYPRIGIMLNTGRLMNTNPNIRTQEEGAEYVCARIAEHGELAKSVIGLRLSQSLSGEFVRRLTHMSNDFREFTSPPYDERGEDIMIGYIRAIEQKLPWTVPDAAKIVKQIEPKYLVHAPLYDPHDTELSALKQQLDALRKEQVFCG